MVLDVLLDRQPHSVTSAAVWAAIERGAAKGRLAAHSITTIHYLVRREFGESKTRRVLSDVRRVFQVAPVDGSVVDDALRSPATDFEDSVTASAAQAAGCDYVVTRDTRGFRRSAARALTPEEFLAILNLSGKRFD